MAEKKVRAIEGMQLRVARLKPAKAAAKAKIVFIECEGDDATLRSALDAFCRVVSVTPTQK